MNVYFISGLGAECAIFKYIRLPDGFRKLHLEWIPPFSNERLSDYAHRLSKEIEGDKPFALVGLSLGGIVASEIARVLSPEKIVLISSIPDYEHLPVYFKWAGKSKLYRLVPPGIFKKASMLKHFFRAESAEDKELIADMIRRTDDKFISWAIEAVLHWKPDTLQRPYVQIHGSKDQIFPIRYAKPSHVIKGGDHILVLSHHHEINSILQQVLLGG